MSLCFDTDINNPIEYPYWFISKKIDWFTFFFQKIMYEEEWTIVKVFHDFQYIFMVVDINTAPVDYKIKQDIRAYSIAREYGWDVNPDGILLNYDENKLIRNKHILTGTELGLL